MRQLSIKDEINILKNLKNKETNFMYEKINQMPTEIKEKLLNEEDFTAFVPSFNYIGANISGKNCAESGEYSLMFDMSESSINGPIYQIIFNNQNKILGLIMTIVRPLFSKNEIYDDVSHYKTNITTILQHDNKNNFTTYTSQENMFESQINGNIKTIRLTNKTDRSL